MLKYSLSCCSRLLPAVILAASFASASTEIDRKFALETVGVLRSYDNVDGLFGDYVMAGYKDYFSKQSRFVMQDLSKADEILSRSRIPYNKLVHDPQILDRLSRSTRSQSILRTGVAKEGTQYRFTIEWLHSPAMDLLATETFVIAESDKPSDGLSGPPLSADAISSALAQGMDRLVGKIPFLGQVTGRDGDSVTVNIGANARLNKGDTLVLSTIEEAKRHPLLKAIVDWRLAPTGRARVEAVEERLAFCRIIEEEAGRKVARFQKVTQILPAPPEVESQVAENATKSAATEPPRIGWVSGGASIGSFSRQYVNSATGVNLSGSSLYYGPSAQTQVWFSHEWFAELGLGYGLWSFEQSGAPEAALAGGAVSAHLSTFRLAGGYSYLGGVGFEGLKGWVKLGYQTDSYGFPLSPAQYLTSISISAPFLGIGGELPIRDKWSALVDLNFGLFTSASETGELSGPASGANHVDFFLGAHYRHSPKIGIRGGVEVVSDNASFRSEQTTLSQKAVTLGASIRYFF